MSDYALDANIVSYALKMQEKITEKLNTEKEKGTSITIPPMVYFEIKRWLLSNNASAKMKAFEKIYSQTGIGLIDKQLLDLASSIYVDLQKQGSIIDDADILIAAYCIKHDLILVTNNVKHFDRIKDLQVVNWMD
jgi:tRNA(fMet)-specific endonuclease VapC